MGNSKEKLTTIKDFVQGKGPIAYGHDLKSLNGTYSEKDISYPERALLMAGPEDFVFLNKKVDSSYIKYLKFVGIGPKYVVHFGSTDLHHGLEKMRKLLPSTDYLKNVFYSPFISRQQDFKVAQEVGMNIIGSSPEITDMYYDKAMFKAKCEEIGIETAIGGVFEKTADKSLDQSMLHQKIMELIEHPKNANKEVIIRACNSEGGLGIYHANSSNLAQAIEGVLKEEETKFLIEVKEDVVNSPSAIGLITDHSVSLFTYTSQILHSDGVKYLGTLINENSEIPKSVVDQFQKIGSKMQKDGYRGPFGIDFIQTRDGKIMPCENNSRVTGAFYPWELKKRIEQNNGTSFKTILSMNIESKALESFTELLKSQELRSMLYKKGSSLGLVPFRVSDFANGEICYVVLGNSQKEVKELSDQFLKALKRHELTKRAMQHFKKSPQKENSREM